MLIQATSVSPHFVASPCYSIFLLYGCRPFAAAAILGSARLQGIKIRRVATAAIGAYLRSNASCGGAAEASEGGEPEGVRVMTFKVYSGPAGSDDVSPIHK